MRTLYAWKVSVPLLFHDEEKIVVAPSMEIVVQWLEEHMKTMGKLSCRIDSVVNVGEVVMECREAVRLGSP
jgi:hypothetical protein